ncbi:MAG: PhoH family protein [Bacilli bacterium]
MIEFKYQFNFDSHDKEQLFNQNNDFISKFLVSEYNINIKGRLPDVVIVTSKSENVVRNFLDKITSLINRGVNIETTDLVNIYDTLSDTQEFSEYNIIKDYKGKIIKVKSSNQLEYVKNIEKCDLVFGVGPAGTGKTFLAVCMAVKMLNDKQVEKVIIARPAVEAGENLGFLPGDLKEKIDPYLQPIYDGLNQLLGVSTVEKLIERKIIEIAPLAYMRGRTLNDAFVILDEAQNTTKEQMKMFLTRLGVNSKMVITGDDSQIDLKNKWDSGLIHSVRLLSDVKGIKVTKLDSIDVVRHYLVRRIISAYNKEM